MINEYETQSELNPKLWDGDQLQPVVDYPLIEQIL